MTWVFFYRICDGNAGYPPVRLPRNRERKPRSGQPMEPHAVRLPPGPGAAGEVPA